MTRYYTLEAAFHYDASDEGDPTMGDWLDDVVDALEDLEGLDDVMVVAGEESSSFVVSLLIEGQSGDMPENMVGKGMSGLRTAFHACEASTPGWPSIREALLWVNLTPADAPETAEANAKDLALAGPLA